MRATVQNSGTLANPARTVVLVLAFGLALTSFQASAQDEMQSPVGRIRPSVVAVVAFDGNNGVAASGLGFFLSETGLLLTRACLFRGATRAEIKTSDGTSYALTKIVGIDAAQSLAILAAEIGNATVKAIAVNTSAPQRGDEVMFFVDESLSSLAKGRITDTWQTSAGKVIEISAAPATRSEGSPVLNLRGEVVGVTGARKSSDTSFLANSGASMEKLSAVAKNAAGTSAKSPRSLSEQFAPYVSPVKPLVLQGMATKRVAPEYPDAARYGSITGSVFVQLTVNEKGKVISAQMIRGHSVFKVEAEAAARRWEFAPNLLCGLPLKVIGTITFNFNR